MSRWVVKTIITYPFLLCKSIQDIVSFPGRPLLHRGASASKEEGTSGPSRLRKTNVAQQENASAGCSKRPFSKAAASEDREAYPLGYVEDLNDARTTLAGFFSILLISHLAFLE
jgi:hypothetical protein